MNLKSKIFSNFNSKIKKNLVRFFFCWRKMWDSNSRGFYTLMLSKHLQSATLSIFHIWGEVSESNRYYKGHNLMLYHWANSTYIWRCVWDLNPRSLFRLTFLAGRRIQPLYQHTVIWGVIWDSNPHLLRSQRSALPLS